MMTQQQQRRRRPILALLLAAGLGPPVARAAHAHLPAGSRGPNGGQVQGLGPYHAELLAADGVLTLFLFDHRDRPVDTRGASGSATVLAADGPEQTLQFTPLPDGSALVAHGTFKAGPGLRVVIRVAPGPGIARAQARFTLAGS